ncbi:MAG: hypothetical protein A4S17_08320 [Proteobacteria bacterium HN_bin10]|nr:MAG: hypothetical protein A4S17_08320 [Proteobacteria bacterium HN_bin10]
MTWNLLLWKWSDEYDTAAKRKGVTFSQITSEFAATGDHPALGDADIDGFCRALDEQFGADDEGRMFTVESRSRCAVVNSPLSTRLELIPKIAAVGRRFGLNAAEF